MAGERAARALERIEAAMRRIELAAQRDAAGNASDTEHRYHRLWTETNAALSELDQLIGTLEP